MVTECKFQREREGRFAIRSQSLAVSTVKAIDQVRLIACIEPTT
jgi:hypothetical protein